MLPVRARLGASREAAMRKFGNYRRQMLGAVAIAAIGAAGASVPALASPGSGVTPTVYTTATLGESVDANHDRVKFQTKEPTVVRMQKLEFAAGGTTGFHHHPGVVIVAIESGSLTLLDSSCATESYGAGQVFVENSDHVHTATSPNGAVVYVTYIVPNGNPTQFAFSEPVPLCAAH